MTFQLCPSILVPIDRQSTLRFLSINLSVCLSRCGQSLTARKQSRVITRAQIFKNQPWQTLKPKSPDSTDLSPKEPKLQVSTGIAFGPRDPLASMLCQMWSVKTLRQLWRVRLGSFGLSLLIPTLFGFLIVISLYYKSLKR